MEVLRLHLVHYGANSFDAAEFGEIKNRNFVKPSGGLWASPVESDYGWRHWCTAEEYQVDSLKKSFTFWYEGNVLVIDDFIDLSKIVWREVDEYRSIKYPDFEEMLRRGVDAIWLTNRGQWETRDHWGSGRSLYGWDCESVLIMNPDKIEEVR
jgi:hypothetical protein